MQIGRQADAAVAAPAAAALSRARRRARRAALAGGGAQVAALQAALDAERVPLHGSARTAPCNGKPAG